MTVSNARPTELITSNNRLNQHTYTSSKEPSEPKPNSVHQANSTPENLLNKNSVFDLVKQQLTPLDLLQGRDENQNRLSFATSTFHSLNNSPPSSPNEAANARNEVDTDDEAQTGNPVSVDIPSPLGTVEITITPDEPWSEVGADAVEQAVVWGATGALASLGSGGITAPAGAVIGAVGGGIGSLADATEVDTEYQPPGWFGSFVDWLSGNSAPPESNPDQKTKSSDDSDGAAPYTVHSDPSDSESTDGSGEAPAYTVHSDPSSTDNSGSSDNSGGSDNSGNSNNSGGSDSSGNSDNSEGTENSGGSSGAPAYTVHSDP